MKSTLILLSLALLGAKLSLVSAGILDCPKAISEAQSGCSETLYNRLDLDDKISEKLKEDSPSAFKCCYWAEYSYCMKSKTKDDCGDTFSSFIAKGLKGGVDVLSTKCSDYEYPSATCIFFVWFWFILGAIAVFFLISLGCCIARCLCGRK